MQYRIELEGNDKFFKKGVELVNQNKNQEAITKFKKSLGKNSQHVPTYRNLAYLYFISKQYDKLIKVVDEAIKVGIKDAGILHYKGYALKLSNNPEKAITALNSSLEQDPEDTDTLLLLGNTYQMLKQYDQAIKQYDTALSLDPTYELVRGNKLTALELKGDNEAFKNFGKECAEYFSDKALKYQNNKKYLVSLIFYRNALRYYDLPDAKNNISSLLRILDENPDRYSEFGLKLFDLNNWKDKGLLFLEMGDLEKVTMGMMEKNFIAFRAQQEIPVDNLTMIPFNKLGISKTLFGVEFVPGAFKKFNSIYMLPFFKINYPERGLTLCAPIPAYPMKDLMEEYGIQPVKLSIWNDPSLTFYKLGSLNLTISETYERIFIILNQFKLNLDLFKMFPLKDILIVAIEKYQGAYLPFEKKTGLKPITIHEGKKKFS